MSAVQRMTDEEREAEIVRAGEAIQQFYQEGDLEKARRYAYIQSILIAGRSAEVVAAMEKKMGIR